MAEELELKHHHRHHQIRLHLQDKFSKQFLIGMLRILVLYRLQFSLRFQHQLEQIQAFLV